MAYRLEIACNATVALDDAARALVQYVQEGYSPVMLVPSSSAVARVRRALSKTPLSFGVRVETLSSWVEDQWGLFGDGRPIVSPVDRMLLAHIAVTATPELEPTPGVVNLIALLAQEALPLIAEAAPKARAGVLSSGERALCAALEHYTKLLNEKRMCEASEAALDLSNHLAPMSALVFLGFDELGIAYQHMVDKLADCLPVLRIDDGCRTPDENVRAPEIQGLLGRLFAPCTPHPLEPTGAVRFLLPAGQYAEPHILAEEVVSAVERERKSAEGAGHHVLPIVVACREPAKTFSSVADRLALGGVSSALFTHVTFAETSFGCAFLALAQLAFGNEFRVSLATDFALSAFSGMTQQAAWIQDALWRRDRTVDRARVMCDLAAGSKVAKLALAAFSQGEMDTALAIFQKHLYGAVGFDPAFRSEQVAAIGAARRFMKAAARVDMCVEDTLLILGEVSLERGIQADIAVECGKFKTEPTVLFMGLADVAERPSCSCSTLVLCDLSARAYPVRVAEDGGSLLLKKLELSTPVDALAFSRRMFFRALSCAREMIVCERVLSTVDADEAYPAVMYEELLDCYRYDISCTEEVDRLTGLPFSLVAFSRTAGEGNLHNNLAIGGDACKGESLGTAVSGTISEANRCRFVHPAKGISSAEGKSLLLLSPSAIESYLECPGKWFAQRRLRLSEPDAGFGPLEMGSFSHSVLKSFYEHFIEAGHPKVNKENLPEARRLLQEIFQRHLAFQSELKPNRNPLIPRTAFERAEVHELERRLVNFLEREQVLLPQFVPTHFEFDFGSSVPFEYAGCALRGSVDRIDVNEHGQAVVIDYKGSLSKDYAVSSASSAAHAEGVVLPHKVQTLMYAQVVKRLLGYEVVGALYVSYGSRSAVMGAFDRTTLGEEAVPGIDGKHCGVPGPAGDALGVVSFSEALDCVEAGVASAACSMAAGFVVPDPRGEHPCKWCPVLACDRRKTS